MRILANENFPADAVSALRDHGHDVAWIRTDSPGISDTEVLDRAQRENRILLTFDKDFGELAFRLELPSLSGIILFRISASSSAFIAQTALAAIESRDDWRDHFAVVEDARIRMTPIPKKQP
jgi:predicted nuclease of predicted toxin-antitoxin system